MKKKKQVLFAHQSTIPHYRVEFYNCLHKLKPDTWDFSVVFDKHESKKLFFSETNHTIFSFPTKSTKTYTLRFLSRTLKFQTFPFNSSSYDLIVVGSAFDNLSYPFSFLLKFFGKKVAFWGQGKDYKKRYNDLAERLSEKFKIFLSKKANLFLAYTNGVRDYLVSEGVNKNKIIVFNNTIDILKHRKNYESILPNRELLRGQHGLKDKKVLLYVGRLIKNKKIDFILETFDDLYAKDNSYRLILIGSGDEKAIKEITGRYAGSEVLYKGFVPDDEIVEYFVMSDLYIFPGSFGLGPLLSLCYDLIPVIIKSDLHSPEIEYFNEGNTVMLPENTSPAGYADAINELLNDKQKLGTLRKNLFPSIQHLTIENMARNFIEGINRILKLDTANGSF